jgi:hypothetical protein
LRTRPRRACVKTAIANFVGGGSVRSHLYIDRSRQLKPLAPSGASCSFALACLPEQEAPDGARVALLVVAYKQEAPAGPSIASAWMVSLSRLIGPLPRLKLTDHPAVCGRQECGVARRSGAMNIARPISRGLYSQLLTRLRVFLILAIRRPDTYLSSWF